MYRANVWPSRCAEFLGLAADWCKILGRRDRRYVCPHCHEPVQNTRAVRIRLAKGDSHIPCQFRDNHGQASGRKIYVQLKCGGSHLRQRKRDETQVFDADQRHLTYWTTQPVDVYLVIRDAEKKIRWMNATRYLNDRDDKRSRQIVFDGEEVTTEQMWQVRDKYLG